MRSPYTSYFFTLLMLFFAANVAADGLRLQPSSLTLNVGATGKISVTKYRGTVSASSSKPAIAKASFSAGSVSVIGVSPGSATIIVRDSRSSKKISVKVVGTTTPSLSVSPTSLTLALSASGTILVANPSGGVSVVSANKIVATASAAGNTITVKALKVGTTTLTVKDSAKSIQVPVTVQNTFTPPPTTGSGNYTLLAWNDLGMHCMDGKDFSVFSILPPYNTLHAQLKNKSGALVSNGVKLTYEATPDSTGSINTISHTKTNFWDWSDKLLGLTLTPDVGVNLDGLASGAPEPGNETPSLTPAPLTYNSQYKWYEAEGIPITPVDDSGKKNFYPTVKVVAKDLSGNVLATTTTVLPVSDEMTCQSCHASSSPSADAKPAAGWVNDPNPEKDWKRNILRLHDEEEKGKALFTSALVQAGYNNNGLLASADSGKPVLCVACHASNAYFDKKNKKSIMGGIAGIPAFTAALHTLHADVKDPTATPANSLTLNDSKNRTACYLCHPGSKTQCLRGAMGKATTAGGESLMSCQSCHGNMKQVGSSARKGWYEEPTCESCHNSSAPNKRAVSGVDANGKSIVTADHTFATNANTPVAGLNLYRFSTGHGGLQCEACHGATHAEYPSLHTDDNTQSIAVQGHAGPVAECTACHATVPNTINGGPHGMHTTGNTWVKNHQDAAEHGGSASCSYCHGNTSAGTPLSAIKVAKTINAGEFGTKNWPAGYQVSCYSCHNGPNPD
jgi:hypothetical protein